MISIIVPAYNAGLYIGKTIDNLLCQEVNKEILIIDDGSIDNTKSIVMDYARNNKCIRYFYQSNKGVSSARNRGIIEAKGEYIIFVDSDDLLADNALCKVSSCYNNENIDLVLFSFQCINDRNEIIRSVKYTESGIYRTEDFCNNFYSLVTSDLLNCIGVKLYRARIIKERNLFFNCNITYCEDISFCIEYLKYTKKLFYIDEPLYLYMFVNGDSLMRKYKRNFHIAKEYLHNKEKELLESLFGTQNAFINSSFAKCIELDFRSCLSNELLNTESIDDYYLDNFFHYLAESYYIRFAANHVGKSIKMRLVYKSLFSGNFGVIKLLYKLYGLKVI